jgi:hypothetical protein
MKSFNDLLLSPQMQAIIHKTAELNKLNQVLHAALPLELQGHFRVQSLNNQCLRLETDSAVWATRLRYFTPNLMKVLASQLKLIQIQCSVIPPQATASKRPAVHPTLSTQAKSMLSTTAAGVKDIRLKAALEKLSRS